MNLTDFTVNVYLWDILVGKLSWDKEANRSIFAFSDQYLECPYDISPSRYAKNKMLRKAFYGNRAFEGLPEFLADSLPDDWGNALFDKWTTNNHIPLNDMRSLMKLSFIGSRGMGAFEFRPSMESGEYNPSIDVDALYRQALNVLHDRENVSAKESDNMTLDKLILLGTSVGGKHAKGLIAMNDQGEIRSGQIPLPEDFKYYILKFNEDRNVPTCEIEKVYYNMATDAGIRMMPSRLYNVSGVNHFLTERFDRKPGGEKVFTQSLRALSVSASDYMHLFWLCDSLQTPKGRKTDLFRQMVFNFVAGVTDDHSRNFTFMMDRTGKWDLSPAYDMMFTANVWESPSAASHCLAMWSKRSNITLEDFVDFGEDIDIPDCRKIVKQVCGSISSFVDHCDEIGVSREWSEKLWGIIQKFIPKEFVVSNNVVNPNRMTGFHKVQEMLQSYHVPIETIRELERNGEAILDAKISIVPNGRPLNNAYLKLYFDKQGVLFASDPNMPKMAKAFEDYLNCGLRLDLRDTYPPEDTTKHGLSKGQKQSN